MTDHEDSNGQTEEIVATTSIVDAAGVTNERETLTLEQLEAAMLTLRPQVREIFLAYRLDGMSYQQMAEITGLSVRQIEKAMAHAIGDLNRARCGKPSSASWRMWCASSSRSSRRRTPRPPPSGRSRAGS